MAGRSSRPPQHAASGDLNFMQVVLVAAVAILLMLLTRSAVPHKPPRRAWIA
jgi:hypothetical protein